MSRANPQTKPKPKPRPQYDCGQCPAICCSVYERVTVTKRDQNRLAKHFNLSLEETQKRFTKTWNDERILKRKRDPILERACHFLDPKTRRCTIYAARPDACREYPTRAKCAYYDLLKFEREHQDDETVVPLIHITFKDWKPESDEER